MLRILDIFIPSKGKLQQALITATEEIRPLCEHLIDWEENELELMSLIQQERKMRSSFDQSVSGILCSIYHEHMAAYIWRKIFGFGDMEVMVVVTKKYVYQYILKNGKTSFYVNDKFLGEFRKDNRLYLNRRRVLADITIDGTEWWKIRFNGEEVGNLVNIDRARDVNPRAFELRRGISQDAEMVFLSIALYKIVDMTRRHKKIRFR